MLKVWAARKTRSSAPFARWQHRRQGPASMFVDIGMLSKAPRQTLSPNAHIIVFVSKCQRMNAVCLCARKGAVIDSRLQRNEGRYGKNGSWLFEGPTDRRRVAFGNPTITASYAEITSSLRIIFQKRPMVSRNILFDNQIKYRASRTVVVWLPTTVDCLPT